MAGAWNYVHQDMVRLDSFDPMLDPVSALRLNIGLLPRPHGLYLSRLTSSTKRTFFGGLP